METKVVFLGTGTPNPDPNRSGPGLAVISGGQAYLIDAGVGICRQVEKAYRNLKLDELRPTKLNKLFLTHLHSDHTLGLADIIFTPWIQGRKDSLEIYGPRGSKEMAENILEAYKIDIDARINGLEPSNKIGYCVDVKEIKELGLIYEDENVKVEAFFADHMPLEAYGYKFTTRDKVIGISGDTSPAGGAVAALKDCDILIHEVFSSQGLKSRSKDWAIYHASVHTSSIDLGKIAKAIEPKKLVLYHQLFMCKEDDEEERELEMIEEIRKNYKGEIISAKDLDIII